jgi:4-hydroxy-tetrahydrodipicolinate synthase
LKPEGVIPAVVTPFDERDELNEAALRILIRRLLNAGIDGLFCLGTNGEFYMLSEDEKVRVVEIAAEETNGRVPVYAGAGSPGLKETVRLIRRYEEAGADAISLTAPYFNVYSQEELFGYFGEAAASTRLPVLLYNIPQRTGNALQPAAVAELAKLPNVAGIKDSSGSFDLMLQYMDVTPSDFSVLSGNDGLILPLLMAGGQGTVSATANIAPETVVAIYRHWKEGRLDAAEKAQRVLRIARAALKLGTQPAALKAFLNELGLPAGNPRRPVRDLTEPERAQLAAIAGRYREAVRALQT